VPLWQITSGIFVYSCHIVCVSEANKYSQSDFFSRVRSATLVYSISAGIVARRQGVSRISICSDCSRSLPRRRSIVQLRWSIVVHT